MHEEQRAQEMRKIIHYMLGAISILVTCAAQAQDLEETLHNCPDFQYEEYKVLPYIRAAIQLQNMGEESAISVMKEYSEIDENQNKIIFLCRMLFDSNMESGFRRPLIGGAVFLGNSDYEDWSREPVEIVQNIPFLIVRGYFLGGRPERAIDYLEYCEQNCIWKEENYRMPSDSDLFASLDELLNSEKWQTQLTEEEEEFFRSQIEN